MGVQGGGSGAGKVEWEQGSLLDQRRAPSSQSDSSDLLSPPNGFSGFFPGSP